MSTSSATSNTVLSTDLSTLAKVHGIPLETLQELAKRAIVAKDTAYCAFVCWLVNCSTSFLKFPMASISFVDFFNYYLSYTECVLSPVSNSCTFFHSCWLRSLHF